MDRCVGIDTGALGRFLDDEVDGAVGQGAARPPNGYSLNDRVELPLA
jgi:hypothetical protein